MFRVLDNVPEIYINESRDFQLISRLYDILFSGVKYDIDSMVNVLDATLAKDNMLLLMCSRVGFFTSVDIDANVLKYIIASFPYILKYKGSKRGIEYAVNAILKSESNPDAVGKPYIDIHKKIISEGDISSEYTAYIYTTISLYNKVALKEILKYVIPIGCDFLILQYNKVFDGTNSPTLVAQQDTAKIVRVSPLRAGSIRSTRDNYAADVKLKDTDEETTSGTGLFIDSMMNNYNTSNVVSTRDNDNGAYVKSYHELSGTMGEKIILWQTPLEMEEEDFVDGE